MLTLDMDYIEFISNSMRRGKSDNRFGGVTEKRIERRAGVR